MSEELPSKPPRRPRYSGKNPRQFHERYKEHTPELYPEDVAKVVSSGKTPAGSHRPIMVDEILKVLQPQPGQTAIDCTLGYGGHTRSLLNAVAPGGKVISFDVDPIELPRTVERLRSEGFSEESFIAIRANFAGIAQQVPQHAPYGADMVLADLGISSMQLDNPERGFTYKEDGPLDMRMNPDKGQPAAELLNKVSQEELAELLTNYADEPNANWLAMVILSAHAQTPITTTQQLAGILRQALTARNVEPGDANTTIRRIFQAFRIAVNDELGVLDAFLNQLPWCMKPGGRVAILTFHSGEDRRVKAHFKQGLQAGWYSEIADTVTRASAKERNENPRSTSAKLRWAIRSEI